MLIVNEVLINKETKFKGESIVFCDCSSCFVPCSRYQGIPHLGIVVNLVRFEPYGTYRSSSEIKPGWWHKDTGKKKALAMIRPLLLLLG